MNFIERITIGIYETPDHDIPQDVDNLSIPLRYSQPHSFSMRRYIPPSGVRTNPLGWNRIGIRVFSEGSSR